MLGKRIKQARKEKGYSQGDVAEKVGVSKVSICGYENDDKTPTLENFKKLINVLGLTPNYALGFDKKIAKEGEEEYFTYLSKEDLEIISEFKNNKNLYHKLCEDPKRTVELISRKLK